MLLRLRFRVKPTYVWRGTVCHGQSTEDILSLTLKQTSPLRRKRKSKSERKNRLHPGVNQAKKPLFLFSCESDGKACPLRNRYPSFLPYFGHLRHDFAAKHTKHKRKSGIVCTMPLFLTQKQIGFFRGSAATKPDPKHPSAFELRVRYSRLNRSYKDATSVDVRPHPKAGL